MSEGDESYELAKMKAREGAILTSIGGGVLIFDTEGNLEYENELAKQMVEYTGGENTTRFFKPDRVTLITPEQQPIGRAIRGEQIKGEIFFVKSRHYQKGIFVETKATPITSGRERAGTVIIFLDVTKMYESVVLKSDFVSFASHQLRTPLTGIHWATAGLRKQSAKNAAMLPYINDIDRAAQNLLELAEAFLNVSQLEMGRWNKTVEQFSLREETHTIADSFNSIADARQIRVEWRNPSGNILMFSDRRAFRIILQSIVSNAIDYTPGGGRVVVNGSADETSLRLAIEDTGIGIPEPDQPHIFQRFFRASNAVSAKVDGSGLGLYIVKQLVELLGGTISFTSRPGNTCFIVVLPLRIRELQGKGARTAFRR